MGAALRQMAAGALRDVLVLNVSPWTQRLAARKIGQPSEGGLYGNPARGVRAPDSASMLNPKMSCGVSRLHSVGSMAKFRPRR